MLFYGSVHGVRLRLVAYWVVPMSTPTRVAVIGLGNTSHQHAQQLAGAVADFFTSTGESPGTNRLEIVGETGKLVCEDNRITEWRNLRSTLDEIADSPKAFTVVEHNGEEVTFEHHASVTLANAIIQFSFDHAVVDLPLDEARYRAALERRMVQSTFRKPSPQPVVTPAEEDGFSSSF